MGGKNSKKTYRQIRFLKPLWPEKEKTGCLEPAVILKTIRVNIVSL
jgi:hypothetical protein